MPKRNDRPKLRQRVPRPRRTKRRIEIPEPLVPDSPSDKLRRLELDFRADDNPVLAWQAIALTRQLQSDLPSWLMDYLAKAAAEITAIFDRVMAGHPAGKEPEQVGKAL